LFLTTPHSLIFGYTTGTSFRVQEHLITQQMIWVCGWGAACRIWAGPWHTTEHRTGSRMLAARGQRDRGWGGAYLIVIVVRRTHTHAHARERVAGTRTPLPVSPHRSVHINCLRQAHKHRKFTSERVRNRKLDWSRQGLSRACVLAVCVWGGPTQAASPASAPPPL
jgi:hypothetical protein